MNIEDFNNTLNNTEPPSHFSDLQKGLWHAAKGDWETAHNIAQAHEGSKDFDHLHAHLHRVEGDEWNAGYWYRRAGAPIPSKPVNGELKDLIEKWT
jgi:hypothetical protein